MKMMRSMHFRKTWSGKHLPDLVPQNFDITPKTEYAAACHLKITVKSLGVQSWNVERGVRGLQAHS